MKIILTALRELYGLFVDDGRYAFSILLWVLIAGLAMPHLAPPDWQAPILCFGLFLILIENTIRSARRK